MSIQFTHPYWLLLLPPALAWVIWFAWKSDVQTNAWRRWVALAIRVVVLLAIVLAIAGVQWRQPLEGMNAFFVLDRSDSIPSFQQEAARNFVINASKEKRHADNAGVIVVGSEAAIEHDPQPLVSLEKIQAVIGTERTDLAAAIRLGTAALPETGQKRLVLLTDGNENVGDAMTAVLSARDQGVTVDVVPLGVSRANDVSVQKLLVPTKLKKGQTFEAKIFIQADQPTTASVRLLLNGLYLGENKVELVKGKNLFTFPQVLTNSGFYTYGVEVDAPNDPVPQNNKASGFTAVEGDPRILIVSAKPEEDRMLAEALRSKPGIDIRLVGMTGFPGTLAEMDSYDAIFLSNISAGEMGLDRARLLESAVRDFGVGLVCIGGDQAYTAGAYRGTPLETVLPVSMELNSKHVLPSGAVALIMHGMEFNGGNQVARDCAQGVLASLGPNDEMGVLLWNGTDQWLFPLQKIGPPANKVSLGSQIANMNQGDLPTFQGMIEQAHVALKKSNSNLKHIIVFSDGDPNPPSQQLMQALVADHITLSTILIAGHSSADNMEWMAAQGNGRFYNVSSPDDLPQVFIKESAVILKSAIYEEDFQPEKRAGSELLNEIKGEYPTLHGWVATSPKARAETPLWTSKDDPLLAHWQYGLGRSVAFTSDAKAKWARDWVTGWPFYRQFWSQVSQWSQRKLESSDFTTDVSIDKGQGFIHVEALDAGGNYRNFLNLQTVVVSPKGQNQTVRLEQTGPGQYEGHFPTKEAGSYMLSLRDVKDGQVRSSQVVGASINYSPEFLDPEPNLNLLDRIAKSGGGKVLELPTGPVEPSGNPFLHDRQKTWQPHDFWESLLAFAIVLFTLDVGVRRIQLDREEIQRAMQFVRRYVFFWQSAKPAPESDESLAALLARRESVRSTQTAPATEARAELFRPTGPLTETLAGAEARPADQAAATPPPEAPQPASQPAASTTSRLLEAKRRAQQRKQP